MVCVANILCWGYADPVSSVAGRIGADPRTRWYTGVGACAPQWFVGQVADRIAAGKLRVAVICGAESYGSQALANRAGEPPETLQTMVSREMIGEKGSVRYEPAKGYNEYRL